MKKKLYLAVLAIGLSVLATPSRAAEEAIAPPAPMPPGCSPSTTLTLVVSQYHLDLIDKAPVCLRRKSPVFTIRVVVAGNVEEIGDVTVGQKQPASPRPVTIEGNYDSTNGTLLVFVQGDLEVDDVFKYFIRVEGVGLIDPRIRIIP
jgi:hypothetical protein